MRPNKLHSIHDTRAGVFNAISGALVNIASPQEETIHLEDIAHALSFECRFGNHIPVFYTVAQHSVLVAHLVWRDTGDPDKALAALFHDASEAYLRDIIKPLKVVLGRAYTDLEERFTDVIFSKFNLNKEHLPGVKRFDTMMLEVEHLAFRQGYRIEMLNVLALCGFGFDAAWSSTDARLHFKNSYYKFSRMSVLNKLDITGEGGVRVS